MSTGRSIDWSRTARSLENYHLRSRPTQRRNGRPLRFRWADERANLRHIYSTMSGPDARSPRYRHHGQSCGSQGRWRAPGNRSGGRVPAISAAVFAGFQSDRTGLQQSEIEAAQGRRAHSQRTLSQNRLDFPLLQNSRMYKFLQACGVRVNVSGICSRRAPISRYIRRAFVRMAASTPMRRFGQSWLWRNWARATRRPVCFRFSIRSITHEPLRMRIAIRSSPTLSRRMSTPWSRMSGAADGHGTPVPRDGCSAPALRAFWACVSLGPHCTSTRAFRRIGRRLESRFDTELHAMTLMSKIRLASATASPLRSSTAPRYSCARRGYLWLTTVRYIGCG